MALTEQEDYSTNAKPFLRLAAKKRLPKTIDGDIARFYDRRTNTFAVYTEKGKIVTFFKPDRGQADWDEQDGVLTPW